MFHLDLALVVQLERVLDKWWTIQQNDFNLLNWTEKAPCIIETNAVGMLVTSECTNILCVT